MAAERISYITSAVLLAILPVTTTSSCTKEGELITGGNPCDMVDCSGHGRCFVEGMNASCHCDPGYHAEGTSCIRNEGDADTDTDTDLDVDSDADTDMDADTDTDTQTRGEPEIEAQPQAVDFGFVPPGAMGKVDLYLRNNGDSVLEIDSIALSESTDENLFAFTMLEPRELPAHVDPMAFAVVEVLFKPVDETDCKVKGMLEVSSNDPNKPLLTVELLPKCKDYPEIQVEPTRVIWEKVKPGDTQSRHFTISNLGRGTLTVSNIRITGGDSCFSFKTPTPRFPADISPGESMQVDLDFTAPDEKDHEGMAIVESDDTDEPEVQVLLSAIGNPFPDIDVQPTKNIFGQETAYLDFGTTVPGKVVTLPMQVWNLGTADLEIKSLSVTMGSDNFRIASSLVFPLYIKPQNHFDVVVAYHPLKASGAPPLPPTSAHYGKITIRSNDVMDDNNDGTPDEDPFYVTLKGKAVESHIEIIPSKLDFSIVQIGCRSEDIGVTIYNRSNDDVQVTDLRFKEGTTPEFMLSPSNPRCPIDIPAGGRVTLYLRYVPTDLGYDFGSLIVVITGRDTSEIIVPLRGSGTDTAHQVDEFIQPSKPLADILFVVDNSGSMADNQENLANNFENFINYAIQLDVDYQIGVITTAVIAAPMSAPCCGKLVSLNGAPKIITTATPNPVDAFKKNVMVGTNGSSSEKGLEAAYLALSHPLITTPISEGGNMELLREQAYLTIIVVSDEDDHSSEPVDFYVDFFKNIKGYRKEDRVSLHAVVVPKDMENCAEGSQEGDRYMAAANQTGGIIESICTDDWARTLSNLGLATFSLPNQFFLSRKPDPDTIRVTVDGREIPRDDTGALGWTYNSASNSVDFTKDDTPGAGSKIEIEYSAECLQ